MDHVGSDVHTYGTSHPRSMEGSDLESIDRYCLRNVWVDVRNWKSHSKDTPVE